MKLPKFEFVQPNSVREACSILKEHNGKAALLAGGTSLLVGLRYRLRKPAVVIDLKGLTELGSIGRDERGGLAIGSMVSLETLANSPVVLNECAPLAQAVGLVAVPPIRQRATIGGNLCLESRCIYYNQSQFWRSGQKNCFRLGGSICNAVATGRRCQAVYQGDLGPVLLAMDAEVKVVSESEEKIIPLHGFFTGRGERHNVLRLGEIVSEIRIPPLGQDCSGAYEKLRVREGMDFPMAGAAVMVKTRPTGGIEKVRMVLGAVGPSPIMLDKVSELLEGQELTDVLLRAVIREVTDKAQPVGNLAMDTEYRRNMVGVMAERALRRALASVAEKKYSTNRSPKQ
jgi:4-hydroxybenzoyl-CoA reductase subunit beta